MLIHSFVVTKVDYGNSVLSGITVVQADRVQRILNAAARLLLRIPKFAPVAALIRDHRALASSNTKNPIQDTASGFTLHPSNSAFISAGTKRSGFNSRGTSKFAIC